MIVAYDARPLQPQTRHWGVGVVVDNVCSRMDSRFNLRGIAHRFAGASQEGLRTWPVIPKMNNFLFELSPLLLRSFDVYWGTNHFLPALVRRPSVLTIHDLLLLKYHNEQRWTGFFAHRLASSVRRADKIVTDSQTTADDLIQAFPEVKRKVEVGLLGFDPDMTRHNGEPVPEDRMPYVVMLGAHRPRKNLGLALSAIQACAEAGCPLRLLISGDVHPDFQSLVQANPRLVEKAGVLPKRQLYSLLRGASALLFPSVYEGFGLPILEAMSVGCPVLALDTKINREIGGGAAWYLPAEAQCWANALAQMVRSPAIAFEMRERGRENLKRFSWKRTAKIYEQAFEAVAE